MKKLLLITFFLFSLAIHGQTKKELASFFQDYLNFEMVGSYYTGEFVYNQSMDLIHVRKNNIFLNGNKKRQVLLEYRLSFDNIKTITETIGSTEFEGKELYTYVITIETKHPVTYSSHVTFNDSEKEVNLSQEKELYLSPASMFVLYSDIQLLKKFTRSFFEGIPLILKEE